MSVKRNILLDLRVSCRLLLVDFLLGLIFGPENSVRRLLSGGGELTLQTEDGRSTFLQNVC
jgi:hypothetical protein